MPSLDGKSSLQNVTDSNEFIGATGFGKRVPAHATFLGQTLFKLPPNSLVGIEIRDKTSRQSGQYWYCTGSSSVPKKALPRRKAAASLDEADDFVLQCLSWVSHSFAVADGGLQITLGQWPGKCDKPSNIVFTFTDRSTKRVLVRQTQFQWQSAPSVYNINDLPSATYSVEASFGDADSLDWGVVTL